MPDTSHPEGDWREFELAAGERAAYEIIRTLYAGQTQYQHVEIAETRPYGLALFLDGAPQSALADEFVYHEALVHPALLAHPDPKRVMIAGGGEGATLREVLRHPSVERATMVDIDGELVDLVRRYMAPMHVGALDDPRGDVVIGDALAYLREHEVGYDAIVIDLVDPSEDGPIAELYGEDFYRLAAARLNEGGILVTQAYSFALNNLGWFARIVSTLGRVFPLVRPYRAEVPFFKDAWGFCTASFVHDPAALSAEAVDTLLDERGLSNIRFYDGITHTSMLALPKYARAALDE